MVGGGELEEQRCKAFGEVKCKCLRKVMDYFLSCCDITTNKGKGSLQLTIEGRPIAVGEAAGVRQVCPQSGGREQ